MTPDEGLKNTQWEEFLSKSISASSIGEWWFCQALITNDKLFGEIETPETIQGSQIHEEEASEIIKALGPLEEVKVESLFDAMIHSRRNIENALRQKDVLANSEDTILFRAICPEIGYVGTPDEVDCSNGRNPIVVELKTTGNRPWKPWTNHEAQIGAYMLGMERLGFHQSYGRLRYRVRDSDAPITEFIVNMDDRLRNLVLSSAKSIISILSGSDPEPTGNVNKCRSCKYSQLCQWSLSRSPD